MFVCESLNVLIGLFCYFKLSFVTKQGILFAYKYNYYSLQHNSNFVGNRFKQFCVEKVTVGQEHAQTVDILKIMLVTTFTNHRFQSKCNLKN